MKTKKIKLQWNELSILREFIWNNSDLLKDYIESEGYDYFMASIIEDNIINYIEENYSKEMDKENHLTHDEAKKRLKKFIINNEEVLTYGFGLTYCK
jgi:hypothetical protein